MKDNLFQSENLIVIGGGGHASVLTEILLQRREKITAIATLDDVSTRRVFDGLLIIERDEDIYNYDVKSTLLVNGVGGIPGKDRRNKIYKEFSDKGFHFHSVISPSALISPFATLGHGVQVMAGAIIQHGAIIGDNCIINTGSIVEHDCIIGEHTHIAPGVTLSGGVVIGKCVHIGTNATVIQSITIGESSVIGAGAAITKNIVSNTIVYPAKVFSRGL